MTAPTKEELEEAHAVLLLSENIKKIILDMVAKDPEFAIALGRSIHTAEEAARMKTEMAQAKALNEYMQQRIQREADKIRQYEQQTKQMLDPYRKPESDWPFPNKNRWSL